ncbi:LLM class flavin-dependent oxidoreductase [Nocardiopsis sp. MG754419]|uniref:LLM class flavin-dependent oxidoreductase n=1 Tax=Nocardiopsis sp. MG754419 TaxID=2259865 RepID=UPI001BA50D2B|nr:LLM class flavin-dependent oxidoreductase [Nocardiopsis sp. MG754419]MBR8740195.1 alkanesulfonate monooxygenase [Nocardiopsis sp. MG754419]
MPLTFHWFLPTQGDGRGVVGGGHGADVVSFAAWRTREPSVEYLSQIALAAERLGFEGALTPTGAWCEDAWLTTAMLVGATRRLKFLVAFRPGLLSPTLAAQMASTYQRLSEGRLLLNVVTGGESAEQRQHGDFLDKDARYRRTDEFLRVVDGLWRGETVDFAGEHVRVEGAALQRTPVPRPPVYFGGSSPAALEVAASRVDTYLTWGEPPAAVADKIARVRSLAAERGRSLEYGIRLHVISRDTEEEAWAQARRLIEDLSPETIAEVQRSLRRSESEGQRRMLDLHGGSTADLEIHPNLWAGVGLARGGAGTALVGSHEQVARLIEEFHEAGVTEFVLSGYPHLEEAYWFGEGVLPLLAERGLWSHPDGPVTSSVTSVPFTSPAPAATDTAVAPS